MSKELFITFEGNDGSGKTTISGLTYEKLKEMGYPVLRTRESKGVDTVEQIHSIILDPVNTTMDECCEVLLYATSRRQHLTEKVLLVLKEGKVIPCSRFVDSSLVYQEIARGVGVKEVSATDQSAIGGCLPDTMVFPLIDFETGPSRIASRGNKDRLDNENMESHKPAVQDYELTKNKFKERMHIMGANPDVDTVLNNIVACLMEIIKNHV